MGYGVSIRRPFSVALQAFFSPPGLALRSFASEPCSYPFFLYLPLVISFPGSFVASRTKKTILYFLEYHLTHITKIRRTVL